MDIYVHAQANIKAIRVDLKVHPTELKCRVDIYVHAQAEVKAIRVDLKVHPTEQ